MYESSERFSFSFIDSLQNLVAVDIDADMVSVLRARVEDYLLQKGVKHGAGHASQMVRQENFLFSSLGHFDVVVGNPPYVRHELIPDDEKAVYRKLFATFKNRSDLYIAFFEKSLSLLKDNGKLSFICADRWMKNQYGEKLRELVESSFNISVIVDVDCVHAFSEKVDAYPAITMIEKTRKRGYIRQGIATLEELSMVREAVLKGRYTAHPFFFNAPLLKQGLTSIEDQGFKIGIGVATGADAVFVKDDFGDVERSLLLPIITTKNIVNGMIENPRGMLFNPFAGSTHALIDLEHYPRAKQYLLAHKDQLQGRYIAKKNPLQWYTTIDRIHPELTQTPKLLIADIQKNSDRIVFDSGRYYPHHNCYYITGRENDNLSLQVLGAILLSEFVHRQMRNVSVLMRGGHVRWQTQNLRKLRLPMIVGLPAKTKQVLKKAFCERDLKTIDRVTDELTRATNMTRQAGKQTISLRKRGRADRTTKPVPSLTRASGIAQVQLQAQAQSMQIT